MFGRWIPRLAAMLLVAACAPASALEDAEAESQRAYIETSYVVAPREVSDFVLEKTGFDADNKYAGAGLRYSLPGHQETRIDVYVYPAGKMVPETAMKAGMEAFRADMQQAVDAGIYTDLKFGDEQPFSLATETSVAQDPASADSAGKTDFLLAVLNSGRPAGRKLSMTLNLQPQDWPMYSAGYLFYKNLYYFKLRASAAQQRISAEDFQELVDLAARTLLPAIEVANIGACVNSTLNVSSDATAEDLSKALMAHVASNQGNNCYADRAAAGIEAKSANAEIVEITFYPQDWK